MLEDLQGALASAHGDLEEKGRAHRDVLEAAHVLRGEAAEASELSEKQQEVWRSFVCVCCMLYIFY